MANWVIPDEGKTEWLARALGSTGLNAEAYRLKLYQNNYTPVDGSTATDFTEATFTGYAYVGITRTDWPFPTIVSHEAVSTAPDAVYTCTGGSTQTIYGAYLIGQSTGKVLAAVKFDTARVMSTGATETVTPTLKLKTFA